MIPPWKYQQAAASHGFLGGARFRPAAVRQDIFAGEHVLQWNGPFFVIRSRLEIRKLPRESQVRNRHFQNM